MGGSFILYIVCMGTRKIAGWGVVTECSIFVLYIFYFCSINRGGRGTSNSIMGRKMYIVRR